MRILSEGWHYLYGKGSHMNLAGKLLIGVPMFPFVAVFFLTYALLDALFSKESK